MSTGRIHWKCILCGGGRRRRKRQKWLRGKLFRGQWQSGGGGGRRGAREGGGPWGGVLQVVIAC